MEIRSVECQRMKKEYQCVVAYRHGGGLEELLLVVVVVAVMSGCLRVLCEGLNSLSSLRSSEYGANLKGVSGAWHVKLR